MVPFINGLFVLRRTHQDASSLQLRQDSGVEPESRGLYTSLKSHTHTDVSEAAQASQFWSLAIRTHGDVGHQGHIKMEMSVVMHCG